MATMFTEKAAAHSGDAFGHFLHRQFGYFI